MIRRTLFTETERLMTVTVIAIQRFRLRSGSLPAELTALVPDYLEQLPEIRWTAKLFVAMFF